MPQVKVNLDDRSYTIDIAPGASLNMGTKIAKFIPSRRVVVLTNTTLARLYQKKLTRELKTLHAQWIVIPDGEKYKTLQTVEKIYWKMSDLKVDRKTALVAFGGGVVGDIGGFVAATYLRGIPFIQVPTTLLAQVDSSVGGKTGVDLPAGKNLVGAFYQPKWVCIDTNFLNTLSKREFLCGLSEVIKYGVLWDEKFFKYIESHLPKILKMDPNTLNTIVSRSCHIKALIVSKDEKESGLRALLNLGHTLGHAIETLSGYNKIHHGEAISMGMMYAATLSVKKGFCKKEELSRLQALLQKAGLPTQWPGYSQKKYSQVIALDKKTTNDTIRYIAVKKIGKAFIKPMRVNEITRTLS